MNYNELRSFFDHHCKIKLRSGKEVFGVLWEEMSETERAIYFASYIERKKMLKTNLRDSSRLLRLSSEDILGIEPIQD